MGGQSADNRECSRRQVGLLPYDDLEATTADLGVPPDYKNGKRNMLDTVRYADGCVTLINTILRVYTRAPST